MQKRKYTQIKAVEGLILSMRQDGMTLKEIADELGLSLKQMKNWSDSFLKECKKETELESYGKKFFFVLTEDHHGLSEVLNSQRYGLLLLYIMNLLLPCVVLYLFYHSLHDRIALTQHCMDQVKEGTYEVIHCEEGSDEVGSMICSYNLMIMRIRELIEVVYKNKEKQQNLG